MLDFEETMHYIYIHELKELIRHRDNTTRPINELQFFYKDRSPIVFVRRPFDITKDNEGRKPFWCKEYAK